MTFALVALFIVFLISLFANATINNEFKKYIKKQQEQRVQEIVSNISAQYNGMMQIWDLNFLHTIGMYVLHDGYIVKVFDAYGDVLWDAEGCNIEDCMQIMNDIIERRTSRYPNNNSEFTSKEFPLSQEDRIHQVVVNLFSNAVNYTPQGGI